MTRLPVTSVPVPLSVVTRVQCELRAKAGNAMCAVERQRALDCVSDLDAALDAWAGKKEVVA